MNRRSRKRVRFALGLLASLGLIALVVFMGILPVLEGTLIHLDPETDARLQDVRSLIFRVAIILWSAAVGACVGSFVNVVVWRMPRGDSVLTRRSACPRCEAPIRLSDNLPIIGWLRLGGRCRTCRLPISARYPVVEGLYAVLFLLVFLAIIPNGGVTLPHGPLSTSRGIVSNVLSGKWVLIAACSYHLTWLSLVGCWALMELDRSLVPWKTVLFGVICGTAIPLWSERLQYIAPFESTGTAVVLFAGSISLLVGGATGLLLDTLPRRSERGQEGHRGHFTFSLMMIGLFCGLQALGTIVALGGLMALLALRWAHRPQVSGSETGDNETRRVPLTGFLVTAGILHLFFWRPLYEMASGIVSSILLSGTLLALGAGMFAVAIRTENQGV